MKKVLIQIGIFFLFWCATVYADTIIIASDNWCPINCEAGSDQEGFMVDIAKKVFTKASHTVEYRNIPWNRTLQWVRAGKIHGAIGPYIEDCPDFIFPKNELAMIGFGIFVKKENIWTYSGVSSLERISIGVIADYSYGNEIDTYIKKNKKNSERIKVMHGETPLKNNIRMLLAGRFDAVVATGSVFWYTAHRLKVSDQLKSAGVVTKPEKAYIAFSPALPTSKEYAKILSNGVAELRKSGELEKILNKYGLTDWKK